MALLLLAALLSAGWLDSVAYEMDEAWAGIRIGLHDERDYGPGEIFERVMRLSPDQAPGYPLLLALWTRLAGAGEAATRSLSWFGGLLALALIWRAGREMFSSAAGLAATALLATSLMFVSYMAAMRGYTLVALFTVVALWGYWRVALRAAPVGRRERAMLLAGGVGLLYSHYYGALLLPALGLFHLTLVRRDRRWQQTMALFLLTGLAFLPALNPLLQGVDFSRSQTHDITDRAMAPHVAVAQIIEVYSNGLVQLLPKVAAVLFALAGALALRAVWRRCRERKAPDAALLLVLVTLAVLALTLLTNLLVPTLLPDRTRYAIGLWPLFCLLIGLGLVRADLAKSSPPPPRDCAFTACCWRSCCLRV